MKTVGINAEVILSRTLYFDIKDDATEEEIIQEANKEIILPHNALIIAQSALRRFNMNIEKLDIGDWDVKDVQMKIIQNEPVNNN